MTDLAVKVREMLSLSVSVSKRRIHSPPLERLGVGEKLASVAILALAVLVAIES